MYFIVKIHRTFIIGVSRWHVDRLDSCHVFAFPILATTIVTTGRKEERRGEEREGGGTRVYETANKEKVNARKHRGTANYLRLSRSFLYELSLNKLSHLTPARKSNG